MSDVVVVTESEPVEEPLESAIEQVIEVDQSEKIGILEAKVAALECALGECQGQVSMHDDLINLHSHEGFTTSDDLREVEERFVAVNEPPPVEEPIVEEPPAPEPPSEPEPDKPDEPPKSRKKNRSFADRYYGRGK